MLGMRLALCALLASSCSAAGGPVPADASTADPRSRELRVITLDPGHFHAALFQKERPRGVSREAWVYAPLGPDLAAHLDRVTRFNARPDSPTDWVLRVYAGGDYLERMVAERPGDILVLSGRNRRKVDAMAAGVAAGLHVLADKPWIIEPGDLPRLEALLAEAARRRVVVLDAMTQRFEVAFIVLRALVGDREVFGEAIPGSPEEPGVRLSSLHHAIKTVAGVPTRRPAWFFDADELGEGLTDVGTHLVDLAQWILLPETAIDRDRDVRVLEGEHWPTWVTLDDFRRTTGEAGFPAALADRVRDGRLGWMGNNTVAWTLRGVHIRIEVRWEMEAPAGGGDEEHHAYRGTRSIIDVQQGAAEGFVPEVTITPVAASDREAVLAAAGRALAALAPACPGLSVEDAGAAIRVHIPAALRIGHEAHFAALARRFLELVADPGKLPAWEVPNVLAKYHVTTRGVELARARDRDGPGAR